MITTSDRGRSRLLDLARLRNARARSRRPEKDRGMNERVGNMKSYVQRDRRDSAKRARTDDADQDCMAPDSEEQGKTKVSWRTKPCIRVH